MSKTLTVTVSKRHFETDDIISLELRATHGGLLPAFAAGAHIDLHLPQHIVRQYSLCNNPAERHRYVIGVLKDPQSRGGSASIHAGVHEGDVLQISEPRNQFALVEAPNYLLLAGGIGITPMMSMAEFLHRSNKPFNCHYFCRTQAKMAFRSRILEAPYASRFSLHYDDTETSDGADIPTVLSSAGSATHLYVCGPNGFIEFVIRTAKESGWGDERIHFEHFGAAPVDASKNAPFEVRLARSGDIVQIPSNMTVLEALLKHGCDIPASCEQGTCGTCLTRVVQGVPDHRDLYLTDDEQLLNDRFLPCCSRSKTPLLVLDL